MTYVAGVVDAVGARISVGEEITNIGVLAATDWLSRAESWSPVTQAKVPSDFLA
jgi:hypothetical protein